MDSGNIENSSDLNITPIATTPTDYLAYTVLGSISVPLNILTFTVILSDTVLLRKSSLIFGLTVGNFLLALFLLTTGPYRLAFAADLNEPATFEYCVSIVISMFYPLAFNTEASFLLLGGVERLLAITTPHWFRTHWTCRNSWLVTGGTLVIVFLAVLIGLVWPDENRPPPTVLCPLSALLGPNYVLFINGYTAVCGAASAGLTVLALVAGIRHIRTLPLASGDAGRIRKQVQLTKSMVTVSCVDLVLVVIPNTFSLVWNEGVEFPWWIRPANSSYTHGINASVAFFAFLAFHSHFRKAAVKLFRVQKMCDILEKMLEKGVKATPVKAIGPMPDQNSQK